MIRFKVRDFVKKNQQPKNKTPKTNNKQTKTTKIPAAAMKLCLSNAQFGFKKGLSRLMQSLPSDSLVS